MDPPVVDEAPNPMAPPEEPPNPMAPPEEPPNPMAPPEEPINPMAPPEESTPEAKAKMRFTKSDFVPHEETKTVP